MRLHSSHSLTMRPHRIQVSSSRWDRLEDAEELDTSDEPLLRREPLMDRMDLESASSNLHPERVGGDEELTLHVLKEEENSIFMPSVRHEQPLEILRLWDFLIFTFKFTLLSLGKIQEDVHDVTEENTYGYSTRLGTVFLLFRLEELRIAPTREGFPACPVELNPLMHVGL